MNWSWVVGVWRSDEMDEDPSVTLQVLEAVAAADGVDIADLEFELYDYVQPEVFRHLECSTSGSWTFTVEVSDHHVEVRSDGRILVDGRIQEDDWLGTRRERS